MNWEAASPAAWFGASSVDLPGQAFTGCTDLPTPDGTNIGRTSGAPGFVAGGLRLNIHESYQG